MNSEAVIQQLTERSVVEIFPGGAAALAERLRHTDRPLRVKLGIDPTKPDLHLGHTVPLRKLRQFQDAGHTAVLIIGGFTAQVGDPSGRNDARPRLSGAEVQAYAQTYLEQARLILDFDTPGRLEIHDNSTWLASLSLSEIIELQAQMTVGQMLAKEDFGQRYSQGIPVYLHEFLYPLLQGYDSVVVEADIELGGTDQKFNLLTGRDLQIWKGLTPQFGLLLPLLEGLDGYQKMSKSKNNYVGLTEDPLTMYSKLEKVPDHVIEHYFELLTDLDLSSLPADPRERQRLLAKLIVSQYHSPAAAEQAQQTAQDLVKTGHAVDLSGIPSFSVAGLRFPVGITTILREAGVCPSASEARRQIENGAVRINGEKVTDPQLSFADAAAVKGIVIQVGKKKFLQLRL
ncbi:MAG: tyrosine--tRNA ligase [Thermostichales cyanobacterium HHBFW_bins_127]